MNKSFLVLFLKKEQNFFLKKEARTFVNWLAPKEVHA